MKDFRGSVRSRVLFYLVVAASAIGLALVIALLLSLIGYFVFGWEHAPVSELIPWLINAAIPLIVLRLLLAWSIRVDRRDRT
jgi:ABC-type sugar transport system permease subunit